MKAAAIAPTGRLRAVLNAGNSLLGSPDDQGRPQGLPADLALALADWLNLPLDLQLVDGAGAAWDRLRDGQADVGFLGIDPDRSSDMTFSTPYAIMEATMLARRGAFCRCADTDRDGSAVAVVARSGPALVLARFLRRATIRTTSSLALAVAALERGDVVAIAGLRHALQPWAMMHPHLQVAADSFGTIGQAVCVPAGRAASLVVVEQFLSSGILSVRPAARSATADHGNGSTNY